MEENLNLYKKRILDDYNQVKYKQRNKYTVIDLFDIKLLKGLYSSVSTELKLSKKLKEKLEIVNKSESDLLEIQNLNRSILIEEYIRTKTRDFSYNKLFNI